MIRNVQLKRVPNYSYKTVTSKSNPLNMQDRKKNQGIDIYLHGMGRTVRI